MAFLRKTLTSIRNSIYSDIISETGQPALRKSILSSVTWAMANVIDGLYQYLDYISLQSVPFTATDTNLAAWGALVGINRLQASAASGTITVTFTGAGLVGPATLLSRSDGVTYKTSALCSSASAGAVNVSVVATDTGSLGNCVSGTNLTFISPILNVSSTAVTSAITSGIDDEIDSMLRTRILQRYANPPQGGSISDYEEWALAVPGVTRVWTNPLGSGAGSVVVYVMMDNSESSHNGFPQGTNGVATLETRDTAATGDQLIVANSIYPLRPVTALVYVAAPVAQSVNFSISALSPNTTAIKTQIQTNLTQMFLAKGSALPTTIYPSDYTAAINAVPGLISYNLISPTTTITNTVGNLPVLGTVSYS